MVEYSRAPSYPTPDWGSFSQQLGDLPVKFQKAQANEIALEEARKQQEDAQRQRAATLAAAAAAKNGDPSQSFQNYSQQLLQSGGDPGQAGQAARIGFESTLHQPAPVSPAFGGAMAPASAPGRFQDALAQVESGGKNVYSTVDPDVAGPNTRSQGYDQINVPTWRDFAPKVGVDLKKYPTPMSAPKEIQEQVAEVIPFKRFGPNTRKALEAQYGFGEDMKGLTVGELAKKFNRGDQYASRETGTRNDAGNIPPVSATAGSAIPRADNAAAPAGPTAAPSVMSALSKVIQDPAQLAQVAPRVAKAIGASDTGAPLTPEQTQKLQKLAGGKFGGAGQPQPQQPQQAPAAGSGPIIPQVPLPFGMKPGQEQQAILGLDKEIARLSSSPNPQEQRQVKALEDWRERIAESSKPIEVRPGQTLVSPRTGETLFQGQYPGGGLTQQAIEGAAETFLKTGKMPPNMGRGVQGKEEMNAIMNRVYEKGAEMGLSPGQIAERQQSFGAMAAGKRLLANRVVGLELVGNEAEKLIPVLEKTIDQLGNGQYSDINAALNNIKKRSGNEDLVRLGVSAESLKSVYARVLKAGGTPTEGAAKKADDLFSGSWSKGQMRTALDQMKIELKNAKESLHDTMKEFNLTTGDFQDEVKSAKPEEKKTQTGLPPGWSVEVH